MLMKPISATDKSLRISQYAEFLNLMFTGDFPAPAHRKCRKLRFLWRKIGCKLLITSSGDHPYADAHSVGSVFVITRNSRRGTQKVPHSSFNTICLPVLLTNQQSCSGAVGSLEAEDLEETDRKRRGGMVVYITRR